MTYIRCNDMRRLFSFMMLLALCGVLYAAEGTRSGAEVKRNPAYEAYIAEWQDVAVQQQQDFGIPAAITLAQGLLESSAGKSELAQNAHNHFGIKCTSDWLGGSYYYDDDQRGECFRVYADPIESYNDHALFLQRSRYKTLYDIPVTDYKRWAQRLRECGYATDPLYAQKLVRIIEDYGLSEVYAAVTGSPAEEKEGADPFSDGGSVVARDMSQRSGSHIVRDTITLGRAPEGEYVAPLSASQEKERFYLSHPKQKNNGRTYVEAIEGDTWANVAFRLNIRERTLRLFNDALGRELQAGDYIYLFFKRAQAPKEKALLWVHPGESLWQVCQREGVRVAKVREYNAFAPTVDVFRTRQSIYMRRPPKE